MVKDKKTTGVEFEKVFNYLKFEGNYYSWKSINGRPTIIKINNKLAENHIRLAKDLAKKLKDGLNAEAVITEALMNIEIKDLEKLDKMLKSKRKYKPKTREGHCVDMTIGKFILPIVN